MGEPSTVATRAVAAATRASRPTSCCRSLRAP